MSPNDLNLWDLRNSTINFLIIISSNIWIKFPTLFLACASQLVIDDGIYFSVERPLHLTQSLRVPVVLATVFVFVLLQCPNSLSLSS